MLLFQGCHPLKSLSHVASGPVACPNPSARSFLPNHENSRHPCILFMTATKSPIPESITRQHAEWIQLIGNVLHKRSDVVWRPSLKDVDRISRGQASTERGVGSRAVPHRLNQEEREIYQVATEKTGFLSIRGSGYRKERKGSPLVNIFRQWCDARMKPSIRHQKAVDGIRDPRYKTSSGETIDLLVVDLSPLRMFPAEMEAIEMVFVEFMKQLYHVDPVVLSSSERQDDNGDERDEEAELAKMLKNLDLFPTRPESQSQDPANQTEVSEQIQNGVHVYSETRLASLQEAILNLDPRASDEWKEIRPIWDEPVREWYFQMDRTACRDAAKSLATLWQVPHISK